MIINNVSTTQNNTGLNSGKYTIAATPEMFKVYYSSLYEEKDTAVLRELAANALDAHIAAGIPDVPIFISLPTELVPELIVQDFGIGMSTDFIKQTYTVYGESTKKDTNTLVGGFGYGAKSPLAIAPSFIVESTKDGVTTNIVTYVDQEGPQYIITTKPAESEKTGTIVRVPVSDPQMQAGLKAKAFGELFRFWPIPPTFDCGTQIQKTNVIEETDTYILQTRHNSYLPAMTEVLLGPYSYRIPNNIANKLYSSSIYTDIDKILSSKYLPGNSVQLKLKFNVGELELPPSRERIEDTPENQKAIFDKLESLYNAILPSKPTDDYLTQVKIAYDVLQRYGIRAQDICPSILDQDNIIVGFKQLPELLKELLPVENQSFLQIRATAVAHRLTTYDTKSVTLTDVAPYTYPRNSRSTIGTFDINVLDETSSKTVYLPLPNMGAILSHIVHQFCTIKDGILQHKLDTQHCLHVYKLRDVLPYTFHTKILSGRGYRSTSVLPEDNFTLIAVPEKYKTKLTKILNAGLHSWDNPKVVYTDDPADVIQTCKNAEAYTGVAFTVVTLEDVEKEWKVLPKTPKKSGTTTRTSAQPRPNIFKVGVYLNESGALAASITNQDASTFKNKRVIIRKCPNYRSVHLTLTHSEDSRILTQLLDVVYIGVSDADFKKPRINNFWTQLECKHLEIIEPNEFTATEAVLSWPESIVIRKDLVRKRIMNKYHLDGLWQLPSEVDKAVRQYPLHSYQSVFLNSFKASTNEEKRLVCMLSGIVNPLGLTSEFPKDSRELFTLRELKHLKKLFDNYVDSLFTKPTT